MEQFCRISFSLKPFNRVVTPHHGEAAYCDAVGHDNDIIDSVAHGVALDRSKELVHSLADVDARFAARHSCINLPLERFAFLVMGILVGKSLWSSKSGTPSKMPNSSRASQPGLCSG
jgi:hypothetical protein